MSQPSSIELIPITGLPMVKPGHDLASLLVDGIEEAGVEPVDGDVLVVSAGSSVSTRDASCFTWAAARAKTSIC